MAYADLQQLLQNPIFREFQALCAIPHCNGAEEKISAYLRQWGLDHGLESRQDEALNVIIKKPATPGREQEPPVLLQAHMDMVCDRTPESRHDFACDPILLRLDGDYLSSAVGTSLGADDGIGVALILRLLQADDVSHPPLEVLFTAEEETTMRGALSVDGSQFQARYLINVDHGREGEILAGGCGGVAVRATLPVQWQTAPSGAAAYEFVIRGLLGGHSGEDIHRGRGNANELVGRLLLAWQQALPLAVAALWGGNQRQAIPREGGGVVMVAAADVLRMEQVFQEQYACFRQEHEVTAPDLEMVLKPAVAPVTQVLSPATLERAIAAYLLSPQGIQEMNGAVEHVVESSTNLGVVRLEPEQLVFVHELRGSFPSTKYLIVQRLQILGRLLGMEVTPYDDYPAWPYRPHSPLRDLAVEVYQRQTGRLPQVLVVHAGIECGALLATLPGLDGISIGPTCYDFHSPQERLNVVTVDLVWDFIRELLAHMGRLPA